VVFVVSLVIGLSKLSAWSRITVQNVVVRGNDVLNAEELKADVNEKLSGNYLFLFSKRNIALYPKEHIRTALVEKYKRIQDLTIETQEANVIALTIIERKPVALWCSESCYYLDSAGYIFAEAPHFTEDVYISYRGMLTDDSPIGASFLTEQSFANLQTFVKNLSDIGISVTSVAVKEDEEYEISVNNGEDSEEGGVIYVNTREPLTKTFENIKTFITDYRSKNSGELPAVEYIDARFGNNIVFKFR